MKDHIFVNLSHYKPQKFVVPEENFATELFVYLLKFSLSNKTSLFSEFMDLLGNKIELTNYENYSILTQMAYFTEDRKQVYPDITIETEDELILIEVKLESEINYYDFENKENIKETRNQIQLYQTINTFKKKNIFMLTKYFCDLSFKDCPDFVMKIRWQFIYSILKQYKTENSVEEYLINEVMRYMEGKNMSIPKVSYEIVNGIESLRNLIVQMESALEGIPIKKSFGYGWLGYYLYHNNELICFVGTYYDGNMLLFQVENNEAIKAIEAKYKNEFTWGNKNKKFETYFNFEENHYFCLKAEEQLEVLKKWIDSIYNKLVAYSGR